MQILTHRQIEQKTRRLAIEIFENNYREEEIILAGINNNGMSFAEMLMNALLELTDKKITLTRIRLNPANPVANEILLEMPVEDVKDKVLIIVDDVANTGRTIFYAFKPVFGTLPKKVEVAVLVNRTHKSFPVKVDYCGLSLATTLKDNIDVKIREVEDFGVFLN
ncbi:MAG: phosphoribosyltransferase [Bacteroidetes bacterium]|nr:MAG: phosphoribosyltransferase [Bacteroidota bacterium]